MKWPHKYQKFKEQKTGNIKIECPKYEILNDLNVSIKYFILN